MSANPDPRVLAKIKSIRNEYPGVLPVEAGILPSAWIKYGDALRGIVRKFPGVFPSYSETRDYTWVGGTYVQGSRTDAWGCVWKNVHTGREAIVKKHPVPGREGVRSLKIPEQDIGFPHGFLYLRLLDLRGFEEMMIDFAEEPEELRLLIDKVLEYNLRQLNNLLKENRPQGSIVRFGDDLGMQNGLAIGAAKWRKYLKPCYQKLYKPLKDAGYYVFMHTDGQIYEIIPDLVECGVDVVNAQFRANGLENLVRSCKGKVCLALDLDRQLFPFAKPGEIQAHVKECVEALYDPRGGLWLCAEMDDGVPLQNIEAVCAALDQYRKFGSPE